ncbi:hypothetical protein JCM16303_001313 [Sporobolomyces ruberrimus]
MYPYQGGYGQPQYGQQPLQGQATGFMPMQPQRTGFAPQPQFQQPQQTGYMQQPQGGMRPPMPMQPQMTGFAPPVPQIQRPMNTGFGGGYGGGVAQQQQQPAPLVPQATGFNAGGLGAGVQGQFMSTFMPAPSIQPSAMMNPHQMQFAGGNSGPSLQQSFQQSNQQQVGQASVPIPWALTAEEKKRYDQIFRAWDQQGAGFIPGSMAKEVFGQAGLGTEELMAIWNLSDVNDRGKLNIDEFHVAMGLIYRRLNGNPIPNTLPAEMAPPSARDLEDSANFLTHLLKNDTNRRATSAADVDSPQSRAKLRSLHDQAPNASRKDATVFRNDDDATPVYKSSSRHLNRDDVRGPSRGDASSELDDVKRRLKEAQREADRSRDDDDEEEDLKEELRKINRKIQRVQDDIDDNRRSGRRTAAKDEERRLLERELLKLEHEDLPRLEKRLEDLARDKRVDRKKHAIERDDRNASFGRYGGDRDRDRYLSDRYEDEYRSSSRRRESPERGYQTGTFDKYDRPRRSSPPRSRTPPPAPPPAPAKSEAAPPPPPSVPPPSSAPASAPAASATPDPKTMSPADRQAFIRAEAQRRIQDRLRALGVAAPSASPDTSVQDRLEAEKAEAASKAAQADEQMKAKELERQAKLERERQKGIAVEQALQETQKDEQAIEQVRQEIEDTTINDAAAKNAKQAADDQLDVEERALRDREEKLKKERAERMARIEQLEREAKEAEENFHRSKAAFSKPKAPPAPPASRAKPAPPPSRAKAAAPPPAAPKSVTNDKFDDDFAAPSPRSAVVSPSPAAPQSLSPPIASNGLSNGSAAKSPGSTNPFHRLQGGNSPNAASPASNKPNPFFASGAPSAPAPPPAPPAPPVPVVAPTTKQPFRPRPSDDDDWDAPGGLEKDIDESDSSDDEPSIGGARAKHAALAQNLFSGLGMGSGRPSSTTTTPPTRSAVASPAPGASSSVPPPPPPPGPPPPPAVARAPMPKLGGGDPAERGALLGQIQGGLRLRKATTVDKSGPAVSGAVIGDASPPVQTYVPPPREPSPPPREPTPPPPREPEPEAYEELQEPEPVPEPTPVQEDEVPETLPAIADEDPLAAVDQTTTIRMRSIFTYEGQRGEDLSFPENRVILANPAKDGGDWWYGELAATGAKGWLPKAYLEEIKAQSAKALYAYVATSEDEISFEEEESLKIVDTSDESWYKAEKDGVIGLVPSTYIELNTPPSVAPVPPSQPLDEDSEDEDDSDVESPAASQSPEAREAERIRVLEAAGLLRRGSAATPKRKRRPPPPRPERRPRESSNLEQIIDTPLEVAEQHEGPPEDEDEQEERMEDAYDLYQRAMREQAAQDKLEIPSPLPPQDSIASPPSPSLSTGQSSTTAASTVKEVLQSTTNSFFSRVSGARSRANTVGASERPKPVISSPLLSQESNNSNNNRSSGMFGTSWASLIDPSALDNLPTTERKRQEACFEFIATEQSYVQNLQLTIETFYSALQPVIPSKALEVIFANIDDILMFNTVFLSELEERQRQSRLYINQIGDIIKEHMKGLDVYRGYCVNQANAARTLADLKVSDRALRTLLDGLRVKNLELEHFLLEPMQRLTRYPLLINQILRYTEADSSDADILAGSLEIAERTLSIVNEAVRSNENEQKLAYLSDNIEFSGMGDARLDLTAPTRLLGSRKLLREGKVEKAKSHRQLNVYLLTDLLIFTETRVGGTGEVVYRLPIPLEESSVRERARDALSFVVTYRGESINVRADSARVAVGWMKDIESARKVCLAAVSNSRRPRASSRA